MRMKGPHGQKATQTKIPTIQSSLNTDQSVCTMQPNYDNTHALKVPVRDHRSQFITHTFILLGLDQHANTVIQHEQPRITSFPSNYCRKKKEEQISKKSTFFRYCFPYFRNANKTINFLLIFIIISVSRKHLYEANLLKVQN